jgi:hypothetical protein
MNFGEKLGDAQTRQHGIEPTDDRIGRLVLILANRTTWRGGALTRGSSGNAAYAGQGASAVSPDTSTGTGSTATITLSADTTYQGLNVTFAAPSGGDAWRAQCWLDIDQLTGS